MLRVPQANRITPTAPEWSVHLTDFNVAGSATNRRTIWTGRVNTCPSAAVLSDVMDQALPELSLEDLAVQMCKKGPVQSLPSLLSSLSCNYWRTQSPKIPPSIDVKRLQNLAGSDRRSVCGSVFKQGDIVWTCRQCAKDPTCVQCDQCFRKSDHVGHEVYFHRASGGGSGCCDCGDEEAWSRAGNCLDHNHPSCDECGPKNPLENCPADLVRGVRAVVKGAVGVAVSYIICTVRGFAAYPSNPFVAEMAVREEPLVVRLHNDDVHTYDQVIAALRAFGMTPTASEQTTVKVDKEGEAVVATETSAGASKLARAHEQFAVTAQLLLSMAPESVVQMESRVAAIFDWFQAMGALSEGLRRIVVEELIAELTSTAHCLQETDSSLAGNATPRESANQKYSARRAFDDPDAFPRLIHHLTTLPTVSLVAPVYVAPSREVATDNTDDADLPKQPNPEYAVDFSERVRRPFDRCHCDALSLMLIGSPYLPVTIKKCINDLVIQFQHDSVFKASFSQQFTLLYPALCVLYCRSIGTAERTIFNTSVQVYTANSVVSMMSSDGAGTPLRLLPEGDRPVMITSLLSASLQMVLLDTGCAPVGSLPTTLLANNTFLTHHSIRTHRLAHLCRDLEYLTADYSFCTRLISEDVDAGMLDIWVGVATMLQNLDCYKRRADTHVEREDDRWQDAANLVLEFEAVSGNFMARALLDGVFAEERSAIAARAASRSSSTSNAPSYVAPIINRHDSAQLAAMRERSVAGLTDKFLRAIQYWMSKTWTGFPGELSPHPRTEFLGLHISPYFCIAGRAVQYHIPDLLGLSSLPVSVHLPLHRLLSKFVHFAACGGVSLQSAVERVRAMSPFDVANFMEYPLRGMLFSAQVTCGMWRRNGYTAANLAYNYGRAPLSKTMRDMDVVSLQLAAIALSGNSFLAMVASRFQLTNFLTAVRDEEFRVRYLAAENWQGVPAAMDVREYVSPLLSELLKMLILITTYTPVCLLESGGADGVPQETWRRVLKREVVHQLLVGVTSAGPLEKVKIMVGSSRTISDAMLQSVVEETCVRRSEGEDSARLLSLKPESFAFFDPEFPSLPNQKQATACDRRRDHIKSVLAAQVRPAFIPLIDRGCLPIMHEDVKDIRAVLFCPVMFTLLQSAVDSTTLDFGAASNRSSALTILSRVVHLVTLQIHASDLSGNNFFAAAFEPADDDEVVSARWSVKRGSGRGLLKALAKVWLAGTLRDDVLYHQGLGWVLEQIFERSVAGRALLTSAGVSFGAAAAGPVVATDAERSSEVDNSPAAKLQRQKAAQQRALQEASKRAAAAMAAFAGEMSDDEDEEGSDAEDETPDASGKASAASSSHGKHAAGDEAALECIVCREKKSTPLGYLCFLQPSTVLRNAHLSCPDSPDLMNVFRVVALQGCKVYADPSEAAPVIKILPQGEHILSENRDGRWLRLKAPLQGWCCLYCNSEAPFTVPAGKVTVNLHPVSDLQFGKHGGSRLHASICGHTMHFDCWDMFYAANYARHESNPRSVDLQAVDIERGESLCPLCKGITNTLLPHVPQSTMAAATGGEPTPLLPSQSAQFCTGTTAVTSAPHSGGKGTSAAAHPFLTLGWMQGQKDLASCKASIQSCFARYLNRGKLSNDNMFYSSCLQQYRASWEADTTEVMVGRNVKLLREQHSLWSATAYTLLNAVCSRIRDRSSGAETAENSADSLRLPESDQVVLRHLLGLVWRSSAWMKHFNSFVSEPLSELFLGESQDSLTDGAPLSAPREASYANPADHFLDKTASTKADLERSLLSMPFESLSTGSYPTAHTINRIGRLAMARGVPERSAWPLLHVPLLAQDLHIIAIAALSSAEDLPAFCTLNQLLCVAKLAQTLIEPAVTGVLDYYNAAAPSEKSGAKHDAKHSHRPEEDEKAGSASKRSRTGEEVDAREDVLLAAKMGMSAAVPLSSGDPLDQVATAVKMLRATVCSQAGAPLQTSAPTGLNLLALALDSWIPYLEFAYHLQVQVFRICNSSTGDEQYEPAAVIDAAAAFSPSLRNDADQRNLSAKFAHTRELLRLLHLPSIPQLASGAFFGDLISAWAAHFRRSNEFIVGGSKGAVAAKPAAVPQWIPTVPAPADVSPGPRSPVSKRPKDLKEAAVAKGEAPSSKAMDAGLYSALGLLVGDSDAFAAGSSRPEHPEPDSDEDRMHDAMEDQDLAGLGIDMEEDSADEDEEVGSESSGEDHYFAPEEGEGSGDDEEEDNDRARTIASMFEAAFAGVIPASDLAPRARQPAAAVHWKLLGVYPINPTVDFPAPELHKLATEAAAEENSPATTSNFMLLMPARAPLQGSLTGSLPIVGYNGQPLRYLFPDLSHMGVGLRHLGRAFIELPTIYTDLYQMTKFPVHEGKDRAAVEDPAICLLCGRILNAGNKATAGVFDTSAGECTLHARSCGAGVGVFFLVQQCQGLLIRGTRAVYWPSLYLDSSGEVNDRQGQNRPLFLSAKRYKKLEEMYLNHQIAKELVRKRASAESVIRLNWF